MKHQSYLFLPVLFTLLALSMPAQQKLGGTVVDVLDGKTVVIEMSNGKVTAVLNYIEIPEPDQQLSQVVRDHLRNLVFGKTVSLLPLGLMPTKTIGKVYLNGVDVGQQMVRDGAAWHTPAARTGQSQEESDSYETYQALARTEKRGVWSILDLKPAWEFRAEKERRQREAQERQWQTASLSSRSATTYGASRNPPSSSKGISNAGALINNYDAARKIGSLRTPILGVTDPDPSHQTAVAVGYFYKEDERNRRSGNFSILMLSAADHARFRSSDMAVIVDGKQVGVTKAKRSERKGENALSLEETLQYTISRSVLEQMANGSVVIIKVGDYPIVLLPTGQRILFNLLDACK